MIKSVVTDCARADIPLFLEPLAYSSDPSMRLDSPEFAAIRRRVVIDTVKRLGALRPDVLKVQFPVDTRHVPDRTEWGEACAELDEAAPVPWALLSGGDPYDLFREQVQVACASGASGFLVGRALWGEYVSADPKDKPGLLETVVRPRFAELSAIATEFGRDWGEWFEMPAADEGWYLTY